MLDWLTDLVRWVAQIVPRIVIVRTTHSGVKFVRGRWPKAMAPGLHLAWPITTSWTVYPIARQSVNLNTQTLITKDNVTIAVGAIVVYEVSDILELIAHAYDPDDTISDISLAAVKSYVVAATLNDLRHARMDRMLTKRIQKALAPWGVKVIRAQLSDLAPCRVIRIWNDATTILQSAGGG
jgi:regulator of protease activity HflC (stomatin/prohibitin superfamily)